MTKFNKETNPDLNKVLSEFGLCAKLDLITSNTGGQEQVFTFDTHQFYSNLHDYSNVDMPDANR
ncbi:hypothetical protein JEU11_04960 [Paraglaciecola chathamensis]|uniref:Uncharacterized protein n=1 Tax=Paraglaciecola chathamensis TaxID=368405 RepID=A0ABS0WBJ7_9ALTE|nr:hypothetical protein [Paraglaciecola chathamensis]MBJ2135798.1 hypothetical protein [Paraglaciecola chathamensis]